MSRREDRALVKGAGTFLDDLVLPGMLHAVLLRSPLPHARIKTVDGAAALSLPGVRAMVDAAHLADRYAAIRFGSDRIKPYALHPLAADRVRYVGEAVACVLASTRSKGEDAAHAVRVDYEPLAPVATAEEALAARTLLHEEWGDNVAFTFSFKSGGVEEAFASAGHTLHESFRMHRHAGTPIETRGILADFDAATERLTVHSTTHVPHLYRGALCDALGLDENRVRVVSHNIGGSFGTKTIPNAEDILIPLLSIVYGVPVKWVETRRENLVGMQAKAQAHEVDVAFDSRGRLSAVRTRIVLDLGAFANRTGPLEGMNAAAFLPGCYDFSAYEVTLVGVVTNKPPLGPYRGFGKSAPSFVIEGLIDRIAATLSLDPAEVRRRNLVRRFPHRSPSGVVYDSGSYAEALETALAHVEYPRLRERQAAERAKGHHLGVGIACSIDPSGVVVKNSVIAAYDGVRITMGRTGRIAVATGSCGLIGTGHGASFAGIVSEVLGVPSDWVEVTEGDTALCPVGQGAYSDRSAIYTATALKLAAERLRAKLLDIAMALTGADRNDLALRDGFVVVDGAAPLALGDVARAVYNRSHALPEGVSPALDVTEYFFMRVRDEDFYPVSGGATFYPCIGNSCHLAVVDVNAATGEVKVLRYVVVDDVGTVLDHEIVADQVRGGVVAGLGGALKEELVYDEDGQLMTGTFMDYGIPTAADVPPIEVLHLESPTPRTPLGAKGVGEAGAIGSYAAVANAVADALRPLDVRPHRLPLTPGTVWTMIEQARKENVAR
ncbi:MAG TPA: xanthine dehydrogenase family protein molybdopterin-binding subunit [Methylomirabilota bacterium]